jgi:hypothetical protein
MDGISTITSDSKMDLSLDSTTTIKQQQQQLATQSTDTFLTTQQLQHATHDIFEALHQIPISVIISHSRAASKTSNPTNLISVHSSTPIHQVLEILRLNNILAVPVYNHPKDDPKLGKEYVGIVSVYDVVAWTVFQKVLDTMEQVEGDVVKPIENVNVEESFRKWLELEEDVKAYFDTPGEAFVDLCFPHFLSPTTNNL